MVLRALAAAGGGGGGGVPDRLTEPWRLMFRGTGFLGALHGRQTASGLRCVEELRG